MPLNFPKSIFFKDPFLLEIPSSLHQIVIGKMKADTHFG